MDNNGEIILEKSKINIRELILEKDVV